MKGNKSSVVLLILLLTAFMGALTLNISRVNAYPGPRIYLEPSNYIYDTTNASIGTKFNVTVWIENVTTSDPGLDGWQIELHYDDTIINVTKDSLGPRGWPSAVRGANKYDTRYVFYNASAVGSSLTPAVYTHTDPKDGALLVGDVWFVGAPLYWKGTKGLLSIIEFEIIALPGAGEFNCTLDITNAFSWIKQGGLTDDRATFEDGYYEISYYEVPPPPPSKPWLEASPPTVNVIKPSEFNVSIYIKNVTAALNLIAVQFTVNFNSTYLEAINVYPGTFMSNASWAIHGSFPMAFIEEGIVTYGEIILPNMTTGEYDLPMYPSGEGLMATITFHTLVHTAITLNITINPLFDTFFMDKDGQSLEYTASIPCTFTYDPIPEPVVSVQPDTYIASSIGENFEIDVDIANLDAQWGMTYAEFTLGYDANYLALLTVSEGPFMTQFGTTVFNYTMLDGQVKVNITLTPTTNSSGSGTLATLAFNVTASPGYSALTLSDTLLLDSEMNEVLHKTEDGKYALHEVLIHPIVWDTVTYNVVTISNTSVTPVPMTFIQQNMALYFNATGINSTIGFVQIIIPQALLNASSVEWLVIVGGDPTTYTWTANTTHTTLYFTFPTSTKTVFVFGTWVVPEMTQAILLLALLAATLTILAAARAVKSKKSRTLLLNQ